MAAGAAMPGYDKGMTTTPSVRIDPKAKRTDSEPWQRNEILAGKRELDAGKEVSHDQVSGWLRYWGQPGEGVTSLRPTPGSRRRRRCTGP